MIKIIYCLIPAVGYSELVVSYRMSCDETLNHVIKYIFWYSTIVHF